MVSLHYLRTIGAHKNGEKLTTTNVLVILFTPASNVNTAKENTASTFIC